MSILIKDMEMPTSCPCELLGIGYDLYCSFAGGIPARVKEYYECCQNGTRPSWCPLVPVPSHYDLIDHNALKIAVMDCDCETRVDFLKHTMDCINKAPVVIPSDMPTYGAEEGE